MTKRSTPQQVLEVLIYNGRLWFLGVSALVCLLALSSQPASAQVAFGSIVGNVTDATAGGISGASVKITLTSTNDSRSIVTDAAGAYTIATVIPGVYRVEVSREGFRTFVAADILG
jgi:Carboxypeptidase regulatory-like domain